MAVMNFDLEDGLPPVKITLNIEDTERFVVFLHECEQIRNTPQRTWVGLTDEEIWACLPKDPDEMVFARAIEAKLKEKNL